MFKVKPWPTVITSLLLIVLIHAELSSLFAQPVDLTAAKKEGKVIVYGTVVPQVMDEIDKAFEKKYGIRVLRDPQNQAVKTEIDKTRGASNAEKSLGRTDLRC